MSFETLEQRFERRAQGIYNKFSNPEQLQEIKPDFPIPSTKIRSDSRMFPIVSTTRDVGLLTKYLASPRGREQFLAKQFLLQKTNTFAETRLYNPAEVLANAVPTVNLARHLGPTTFSARNTGALQKETAESANNPAQGPISRILGGMRRVVANPFTGGPTKVGPNNQYFQRPEDIIFGTTADSLGPRLPLAQTADTRGQKRAIRYPTSRENIPDINATTTVFSFDSNATLSHRQGFLNKLRKITGQDDTSSAILGARPFAPNKPYLNAVTGLINRSKFSVSNGGNNLTSTIAVGGSTAENLTTGESQGILTIDTLSSKFKEKYNEFAQQTTDGRPKNNSNKYFAELLGLNGYQNPYYLESAKVFTQGPDTDNASVALDPDKITKSTIKDLYNTQELNAINASEQNRIDLNLNKVVYSTLVRSDEIERSEGKKDIIRFVFRAADNSDPVHFRAFISELAENVETEYNEDRYVGRTERFVTYAGAKRSVSLKFKIVAFSEDEIDNVWLRMNYLTGLAFPKGASQGGFMIPPLFKVTIGGIYENQPCYVKTLDYTLIDDKITFDIDNEVPQHIEVQMKLQLLEKSTRYYNSPFYQISQKLIEKNKIRTTLPPIPRINSETVGNINTVLPNTRPQFGTLKTTPPPLPAPAVNPNRPIQIRSNVSSTNPV